MDITNPIEVAATIKFQRKRLELSQEAVAREANVSTWTVNQVEKSGTAKLSTLRSICDVLQIAMYYGAKPRKARAK